MDPRRFLPAVIGVLVVLGLAALLVTRDDGDDGERLTAGSGSTTTTFEETTTTTVAPATTTTVALATTTTAAPVTTTTRPRPTTTTSTTAAGPARTWSISPTSGPANTRITASGSGCLGQDAGVALTISDPSGQPYNGDGGSALPDGTWQVPTSVGAVPPGRYTIKAACQGSNPFQYRQVHTFTVTG